MSLISSEQKASIEKCLEAVHETFKQDIFVYVEEGPDIPVGSTYNPLFGRESTPRTSTENILVKHTRQARIYYPDRMLEVGSKTLLNIPASQGRVRLKVDLETLELIKQSTKVGVGSAFWTLDGDDHPEGPFSTKYYMIFLKRIN